MRPLEKSLDKLDEVRKKKLSEMIGVSVSGSPTVAGSGGASTEVCLLLHLFNLYVLLIQHYFTI